MTLALSAWFLASYVAMWVLLLSMAVLMVVLFRHFGLVTMGTLEGVQRDGLPIGDSAPPVAAVTADGAPYRWDGGENRQRLVLFGAPGCEPCGKVLPYLATLTESMRGELDVVVVVPGPSQAAALMARELPARTAQALTIVGDEGSGAADTYRVRVTPFAFALGSDRVVRAKGLCGDPIRLRELLAMAGFDRAARSLDADAEEYIAQRQAVTASNGKAGVA
jgi:methylamine dehydrogenase accessory protein MauD